MEDIIQDIANRLGINREMAAKAVDIVFEHMRNRLPAPVTAQIESMLHPQSVGVAGPAETTENPEGTGGLLGRFFG